MKKLYLFLCITCPLLAFSTVYANCDFANSNYEQEWKEAYFWACNEGIISEGNINIANLNKELSRIEMAKMLNIFSMKFIGKEEDPSKNCKGYNDLNQSELSIANKSCHLGIMGIGIDKFRPKDSVSRAEFGTVLSRILYGDTYNVTNGKYYEKHLKALKDNSIITNVNPNLTEKKGYILIMLKRYIDNKNKENIKTEISYKSDDGYIMRNGTDVTFSNKNNSITLSSDIKSSKDGYLWSDSLQGPCNPGYHVPSKNEYSNLINIWMDIRGDELYNVEKDESGIGQDSKEKYGLRGRAIGDIFLSDIYGYETDAKHPTNLKAQPLFRTRSIDYTSNNPYYLSVGTYRDYMTSWITFQTIGIKSKLYKIICFKN